MNVFSFIMPRAGSRAIPAWVCIQNDPPIQELHDHDLLKKILNGERDHYPQFVYRMEYTHIRYYREMFDSEAFQSRMRLLYGIRDPWNHIASYLKFNYSLSRCRALISSHKVVMRHILNIEPFFPANSVFVNYNRWFNDLEHRKQIAEQLCLDHYDREIFTIFHPFETLPKNTRTTGNPKTLDVFNRWREYVNDAQYQKLLDDPELIELSGQLFENPL